ncbi:apolipoprotein N-acyltransferase [Vibrio salinus]|uniref:apolipoprotein N-acyltransferase n=1 Tax=Vibrio salinus TaxID=2899784 RepID=UPI003561334D
MIRPFLAVIFGAIAPLAFAPYSYWPIIFLSVTGLLILLRDRPPKNAAWLCFLWGVAYFGVGISWVHVSIDTFGGVPRIVSFALMLLLSCYLAIYPALFGWVLNRWFSQNTTFRLLLIAPVLWLCNEWLRGWVFTGFPWLWIGYSQVDTPFAQYAPIGGVEAISFIIIICSGAVANSILKKQLRWLIFPVLFWSLGSLLNAQSWVTPDNTTKTSFALIQGNIDQAKKWLPGERWPTIIKYTDLTQENWDANIIIWPEAAVPAFEYELPGFLTSLDHAARQKHSSIVTGILNQSETGKFYNSILTMGAGQKAPYSLNLKDRYHKHHLLPFGEFVPFETLLRPLAPLFNLPMSSFTAGSYIQPNLSVNGRHFVSALCYEIAFGEQVRENVTNETDFILTLSNDAWFGHSIGPFQHMEIARMRALELGKPLIRVTNNGITAITNAKGQVIKQLPQFKTAVLRATIESTKGKTPYYRFGSWPLYGLSALILLSACLISRKNSKRSDKWL